MKSLPRQHHRRSLVWVDKELGCKGIGMDSEGQLYWEGFHRVQPWPQLYFWASSTVHKKKTKIQTFVFRNTLMTWPWLKARAMATLVTPKTAWTHCTSGQLTTSWSSIQPNVRSCSSTLEDNQPLHGDVCISSHKLAVVEKVKLLGVIIDKELKWEGQVDRFSVH